MSISQIPHGAAHNTTQAIITGRSLCRVLRGFWNILDRHGIFTIFTNPKLFHPPWEVWKVCAHCGLETARHYGGQEEQRPRHEARLHSRGIIHPKTHFPTAPSGRTLLV